MINNNYYPFLKISRLRKMCITFEQKVVKICGFRGRIELARTRITIEETAVK